jgi:hypothetical protein
MRMKLPQNLRLNFAPLRLKMDLVRVIRSLTRFKVGHWFDQVRLEEV